MDFTLMSAPRISREGFRLLLSKAPRETLATADIMYNVLVEAGVDPAFALSQAVEEHGQGYAAEAGYPAGQYPAWLGIAGKTRSWGNIRAISGWQGKVYDRGTGQFYETWTRYRSAMTGQPQDPFKAYYSYAYGLSDWASLIRVYRFDRGIQSVSQMAELYLGTDHTDDEKAAYATKVNGRMERWSDVYRPFALQVVPKQVRVKVQVNVRSGPGVAYADVGDRTASTTPVACDALTTNGTPWTSGGVTSSVWYRVESQRWITGHPMFVEVL